MITVQAMIEKLHELFKDDLSGLSLKDSMYDLILLSCEPEHVQTALDRLGVPEDSPDRERDWPEEMLRSIMPW
jgi:hypothetical protein